MTSDSEWQKPHHHHPYLNGNFAPVQHELWLTSCDYTGKIPDDLAGGQYVRNGGNPLINGALGRDAHWFDGDGMLSGVVFHRTSDNSIEPRFVNRYILTDLYLAAITSPSLRYPIAPSIATLVNPASTLFHIIKSIIRTIIIIILSYLPGSLQNIKRISVANTNILYHDGRALATCESGPPMRVVLPHLETVGWFDGCKVDGEPASETVDGDRFGGDGNLNQLISRTTAHPRVDPVTKELILFHSTFFAPFVFYSIIPSTFQKNPDLQSRRLVNVPVPGIQSAKMMHDMGLSNGHCIILDLPLSLDPLSLAQNKPVVLYSPSKPSRFGVFPRWNPEAVRWFETSPCCIFHTANSWDEMKVGPETSKSTTNIIAVNMLACRLTSASLVYNAGDIAPPLQNFKNHHGHFIEEEQCRLYYYRFSLSDDQNIISHQFALSSIQFEFPTLRDDVSMSKAQYIYGCSSSTSTFGTSLGAAAKIDCLVKIDALALIDRAQNSPPTPIIGCVDNRTIDELLESGDEDDCIKVFKLKPGYYAQEPRFIPRYDGKREDDGWLISYIFDESQLDSDGNAGLDSNSELWIIDAISMKEVVCKIKLPLRVPYGFHGFWFSEKDILSQRPVVTIRSVPEMERIISNKRFGLKKIRQTILDLIC